MLVLKPLIHLSVALSLIVLPIAPAHAGKHDPLFTPAPIEVPAGTNYEVVRKAVRKSLFDRGWESREPGPGHIQAKYVKQDQDRAYTAVIEVKYDIKTVRIGYSNSENLNYEKSDNTIHGTYNNWVKNIERDIRSNLGAF
jgi:hypothetical protein